MKAKLLGKYWRVKGNWRNPPETARASFENMDGLQKIETLLEEQYSVIEKLSVENNDLKIKITELETCLN